MLLMATDPEPDPAESKCGGSTWTVLIRVILTPCVMMMVTSERMRVFPGVTLHSFPGGVGPSGVLSI